MLYYADVLFNVLKVHVILKDYHTIMYYFGLIFFLILSACSTHISVPKTAPPNTSVTSWDSDYSSTVNALYLQFIIYVQNQDFAKAKETAEKLSLTPLESSMYVDIAAFYISEGEEEKARHILEQALLMTPHEPKLLLLWVDVAKTQQEAAQRLLLYLNKYPDDMIIRARLYTLYYAQKKYSSILALAKKHKKASMLDHIDYYYTALAYNGLGETEKAIEALNLSLAHKPDFIEAFLELGSIYEKNTQYDTARKLYSAAIRQNPNIPDFWLRLIALNLSVEDSAEALEFVKQGPQTKSFLFTALGLFLDNEQYNDAETILRILRSRYPNTPETHFYTAYIYYERDNDYKRAITELKKIPPTNQFYPHAVEFEANIYQLQHRFSEAVLVSDTARRTLPENKKLWDIQAKALVLMKEYDKAIQLYLQALQRWKNDIYLRFNLGNVYILKKDIKNAIESMEEVLVINNDYIPALVQLSDLLIQAKYNIPQAKILLEKAYYLDANNVTVLYSLSKVHALEGRYEDAWSLIQKAKHIGITEPNIWEYYGDIAQKIHKKSEAILGYEKALEYDPKNVLIQKKLRSL